MPLDPLSTIQQYENAGGDPTLRTSLKNPDGSQSTASGLYQIINGTWQTYAGKLGIDTKQYPTASSAPPATQTYVAQQIYNAEGFAPWTVGNPKLAQAIKDAGGAGAFTSQGYVTDIFGNVVGDPGSQAPAQASTAFSGQLSPLSQILTAIGGFFQRAGVGVLGLVLIAVAAWALARNTDLGGKAGGIVKRAVA